MIIELFKVIFLGIVEGITEWLPISSTGHMILVEEFLTLDVTPQFWNMFVVVIQLGAILAVCVLYFNRLNPFSLKKDAGEKRKTWSLWSKVIVGVLPAAIIGLPLNDFMEEHLFNSWVVAAALIFYGIAFIVLENIRAKKVDAISETVIEGHEPTDPDPGIDRIEDLSYKRALGIGAFQVLSLVPGTSRSGSTILGGMVLGTSRTLATEFSFFMAIPVMFGASLLKIVKYFAAGNTFSGTEVLFTVTGMVTAFIISILSVRFLLRFIRTNDFKPFGWYRIILGVIVLGYFAGKLILA